MESSYRAVATDSGIFIVHDGVKGKSGRYPYGSGEEPYQRLKRGGFLSWGDQKRTMKKLRKQSYKRKKVEQKKAQQQSRKKSYNEMTNEELKSAIERLTLQKQFKELDAQVNPAKQSLGKKFLQEAKESIAKETVKGISELAAPTAKWLGGKAINSLLNDYVLDVNKNRRTQEEHELAKAKQRHQEFEDAAYQKFRSRQLDLSEKEYKEAKARRERDEKSEKEEKKKNK